MKKTLIYFTLLLFTSGIYGQTINYSAHITGPSPTDYKNNQYVFLDFWATWCIPCIKSMPHVEYLQSLYGDKVFFVGITNEQEHIVRKFLERHNFSTALILDYNSENFNNFGVKAIPKSFLIDPNGNTIWAGHPSNMSSQKLKSLTFAKKSVGKLHFNLIATEKAKKEITKYEKITIKKLMRADTLYLAFSRFNLDEKWLIGDNEMFYQGSLRSLLVSLLDINSNQLVLHSELDKYIQFRSPIKLYEKHKDKVLEGLSSYLGFHLESSVQKVETLIIICNSSTRFMDKETIDFSGSGNKLISDNTIEADNMTCDEFAVLLSDVLKRPVVFQSAPEGIYDWNVHYKYKQLMLDQFRYDYNTEVEEAAGEQIYYETILRGNSER